MAMFVQLLLVDLLEKHHADLAAFPPLLVLKSPSAIPSNPRYSQTQPELPHICWQY
jgi:hypothetical protein